MNTRILQKCVEELKKETYSKEYVLGMLETFIELNSIPVIEYNYKQPDIVPIKLNDKSIEKTEEELYREKMLGGRIADTSIDTVISLN